MKTARSQDDICLLCQKNKSDKRGSHYTPAGIVKREIGKRDYEELYSINSFRASTSVFRGRSNLNNTDTTIRQGDHVEDYIFCTHCEKKLAAIESDCNEKLLQFTDTLVKGTLQIDKTRNGNKYVTLKAPKRNILIIYFYSVIWRQCLQQKILYQTTLLTDELYEALRQIIFSEISKTLKEIEQSENFAAYPRLMILTTYHRGDRTKNFINPNPINSNPQLFFIGPFNALLFKEQKVSVEFEVKTGLNISFVDNELVLNLSSNSIVAVINENAWDKISKHLMQHELNRYLYTITMRLSKATGVPFGQAQYLLHSTAQKFITQYPENYTKCLELAFELLTK